MEQWPKVDDSRSEACGSIYLYVDGVGLIEKSRNLDSVTSANLKQVYSLFWASCHHPENEKTGLDISNRSPS